MENATIWIIAFILAIVAIVIVAIVIESNRTEVIVVNNGSTPTPPPRVGQRYDICTNLICGAGLSCSPIQGQNEPRCLSILDRPCLVNQDCVSGYCEIGNLGHGVCRPSGLNPPSNGTQIYCRQNGNWVVRITIPMGLVFSRISSSGDRLLAISTNTNKLYLWQNGQWQEINSFTPPGMIVDGVITNVNDNYVIWLVYRLTSGQTALYRLTNGNITPLTSNTGGLQRVSTGEVILIREIDVHPTGEIYLVGTINGGQVSIFQRNVNAEVYSQLTPGENIYVMPFRSPNSFAFSSGSSILVLGNNSTRQDNIVGNITDIVVTPDNQIWYITNNQLYTNGQLVNTPVTINSTTRIFYSTQEATVCLFTPGI